MNITKAAFGYDRISTENSTRTEPLWQYDYGQVLVFEGIELPDAYEVHFSNKKHGDSVTQIGNENGVSIPDALLLSGESVYAWIYLHTGENDGETEYVITIPVQKRAKPTNEEPTPVQQDAITEAIAALNTAVEKCEGCVEHYPKIVENHWYVWDAETGDFVDTGIDARGLKGDTGTVFTPDVSVNGVISWTNDGGLPNPDPVDLTDAIHLDEYATKAEVSLKLDAIEKGSANGVAELDGNGQVPSYQLPSYVDDVLEYTSMSQFPRVGETGKIYVSTSNNTTYRWSGSQYVQISSGLALGETSSTAYRGDRGKTAYEHAMAKGNHYSFGVYKFETNSQGHVVYATSPSASDIPGMNDKADKTDTVLNTTLSRGRKANTTVGVGSFAFGGDVTATNNYAHAEGHNTVASGNTSHAEGETTTASGQASHTEGTGTNASGNNAHAEGYGSSASGDHAHAEGYRTTASGYYSHTEGYYTTASSPYAHAEGYNTTASGSQSHAEGYETTASASYAHAEGLSTTASNAYAHAEGSYTTASHPGAHAEGSYTQALDDNTHAEGSATIANGNDAHAEGQSTRTYGDGSHAEGGRSQDTRTVNNYTHNVGANGNYSHTEGYNTLTGLSGTASHAEGLETNSLGYASHAEGVSTTAIANYSHAEGGGTIASGAQAHAEGGGTKASAKSSHAEGAYTVAAGANSHAGGAYNIADSYGNWDEWVAGTSYSVGDKVKITTSSGNVTTVNGYLCKTANNDAVFDSSKWTDLDGQMNYAEIIGNGTDDDHRSNARALDWGGNEYLMGDIYVQCNPDGTGGTKLTPGGGGSVTDVQVNGTSVVTDGVANVPIASSSTAGTVILGDGFTVDANNKLGLAGVTSAEYKNGVNGIKAIKPNGQHTAVYYGLSKLAGEDLKSDTVTVGVYPEKSISAIHEMLNAPVSVSGSTPSITAKAGVRYVCGEVSTLTIVLPASGCIDVTFESGSTATVLTVTPPTGVTVKYPAWFDPTDLEANSTYEINIADGNAVVMVW